MPKLEGFMTATSVTTFRANGYRKITEDGGVEFCGCVIFKTISQSLSAFKGKARMYTCYVDAAGIAVWSLGEPA